MERTQMLGIIVVLMLLVIAIFIVTKGRNIIPSKELDKTKACTFWVAQGCPGKIPGDGSIPSELEGWCVNKYDCKERCGKLGISTEGCE